ncbi:MAG: MFS transporter [Bradymonadaceae bacterium]
MLIRSSWALFVGIALIMLGNGLQTSLLGLRATMEGFPTGATGAIMSAFYVGFLAGSRLTPRIVGNVGHIRVFAAWSSMASAAILLHGLLIDPFFWGAMRFVTGFCYAGLYVVAESWLNDRADNRSRGRLLSVYMVVQYAGLAGGQLLLNLGSPAELILFVLTSVLISLALVPIALTTTAPQPTEEQESLGLRALYRLSPLGVMACAGAGLSTGALLGMGAVFAETIGLSVAHVSIFMAMLILGAVCLQFPIGRLSDRFDRRRVIITTNIVAVTVAVGAWAAMDLGPAAVLGLIFLVGGICLPLYALGMAHTNDDLRPGQMVAASSSLVLVFGLGATLGPVLVAAFMSILGPGGFYLSIAGIHGLIAIFAIYRTTRRSPRDSDEQGEYQATVGGRLMTFNGPYSNIDPSLTKP